MQYSCILYQCLEPSSHNCAQYFKGGKGGKVSYSLPDIDIEV